MCTLCFSSGWIELAAVTVFSFVNHLRRFAQPCVVWPLAFRPLKRRLVCCVVLSPDLRSKIKPLFPKPDLSPDLRSKIKPLFAQKTSFSLDFSSEIDQFLPRKLDSSPDFCPKKLYFSRDSSSCARLELSHNSVSYCHGLLCLPSALCLETSNLVHPSSHRRCLYSPRPRTRLDRARLQPPTEICPHGREAAGEKWKEEVHGACQTGRGEGDGTDLGWT